MVIFKGDKRLFDKVIHEESESTAQNRILSIYGVTNYTDIEDVPLQIISIGTGTTLATIDINNLGPIRLKIIDSEGTLVDVKDNWSIPGQIYTIIYRDGLFQLITQNQDTSEEYKTYIITNVDDFINLTSESTQQDIENVFEDEVVFIDKLLEGVILIAQNTNILININYSLVLNNDLLEQIILEFIYNGNYYKQVYSIDTSVGLITEITVTIVDLLSLNTNNINP